MMMYPAASFKAAPRAVLSKRSGHDGSPMFLPATVFVFTLSFSSALAL